jgi:hypothetical protein
LGFTVAAAQFQQLAGLIGRQRARKRTGTRAQEFAAAVGPERSHHHRTLLNHHTGVALVG